MCIVSCLRGGREERGDRRRSTARDLSGE